MYENNIKLNKEDIAKLVELGLYAYAELIRESLELQLFKENQGIT